MINETNPPVEQMDFDTALDVGLSEEMRRDERVFCMATNPPSSLEEEFGPLRARRSPIAESAMTGIAVGASGSGLRPVVLFGNVSFSFVAFDQIVNQAARIHYMFGGQRPFPIVFRGRYYNGTRSAAQHSQTAYALFAHASGLKIAVPSNPADAKGLLKSAVRDDNPVYMFEASRLADEVAPVGGEDELVPFGVAATRRAGDDVTIVAIGYMVEPALQAADQLAEQGIYAEVIDPRTLVPLDREAILASVRRTGRLVIADESFPTCSFASEIAAMVAEDRQALAALRAPIERACTAPVPVPFSPALEDHVLPDANDIAAAASATVEMSGSTSVKVRN